MKIIDCVQGTTQWFAERAKCATASELNCLITPKLDLRTGAMPHTYLCRKLAERWIGRPISDYSGGAMEQGSILEDEARPWYELRHKCDVQKVGFVVSDDGSLGCSPDGLLADRGLEIKCPQEHTHMKWLLCGECPEEHVLQVQAGMLVTGFGEWDFVSYCRAMPPLVVRVVRDPDVQRVIQDAVEEFSALMEREWRRLKAEYGEPPSERALKTDDDFVF